MELEPGWLSRQVDASRVDFLAMNRAQRLLFGYPFTADGEHALVTALRARRSANPDIDRMVHEAITDLEQRLELLRQVVNE